MLMAGCSTKLVLKLTGTYFLDDPTTLSVGQVDETSVYKITFEANEQAAVKYNLESGEYTVRLYTSSYEGKRCYAYETELTASGSYKTGDESFNFDDKIKTVCYFMGVDSSLKPLYSERSAEASSPIADGTGFTVKKYKYNISAKYTDNDAVVTFTPDTGVSTGEYSLSSGEHNYNKVFDTAYFDNEMMLIAMRTMDLNASFTAEFSTIDALSGTKRTLLLTPDAEAPDEKLDLVYISDKEKINGIDTFKYTLSIDGTFSGSSIILNYASRAREREGQRLIKMQVFAPLSMGTFVYTIDTVTKN